MRTTTLFCHETARSRDRRITMLAGAMVLPAMLLLSTMASATVLTWDIAPGTVGAGNGTITGGAGTWNLTNGNWTTNGGATNVVWANTNVDEAIFGGTGAFTSSTVTINTGSGITANKLTFNSDGAYSIFGTSVEVLTLAGTTPTVAVTGDFAAINAILAGSSLNKTGAGTLYLGQPGNTYTGQTNVNAGTLVIGGANSLGTTAGGTVVANGATLDLNGNGIAVGAEALTIQGVGAGGDADAALQSNNAGNSSWAGVVTLAGATSIGSRYSTSMTLSNTVTGGFPLTKVGVNTLILSGANTYTGNTTVSAGTLEISGGGTIHPNNNAATVSVASGATILLSGTQDNAIGYGGTSGGPDTQEKWIVAGTINSTGGHTQSIPVGGVTMNGGTLSGVATASLQGTYYANGFHGAITVNGTGNLINAASVGLIAPLVLNTPLAGDTLTASSVFQNSNIGFAGSIVKNGAGTLTLSGANTYTGGTTLSGGTLALGSAGALGTTGSILLNGGTLQYSASNQTDYSNRFNSSSTDYRIDTNGQNVTFASPLSGAASLTKIGGGTIFLTADNTYTGDTTVGNQGVYIGNGGTTGSIAGNITVSFGGTLGLFRSNAMTFANTITGEGIVLKAGGGTTTLTGNNTYTGGTHLVAGTLSLGSSGAVGTTGLFEFLGGTLQYSASNLTDYSSRFEPTGSSDYRIDIPGIDQEVTFASPLTGFARLTKLGGGTLNLTADNTYTGGTFIENRGVSIGNGGTTGSIAGNVTISSGGTLRLFRSNAMTFANTITGEGIVLKAGGGTATLTGNNTYTGGTHLVEGTLSLGSSGAVGTTGLFEFLGGTLQYSANNTTDYSSRFEPTGSSDYRIDTNGQNVVFASPLTGGASLTKLGSGILVLMGANTYTGGTTIEGGALQVGGGGATGTLGSGPVISNSSLLIARNNAYDIPNPISGTGGLQNSGVGTTILSAVNTYTGVTFVAVGVLQLNNAGALGNGTLNTAGVTVFGGALDLNGITPTATVGLAINGAASSTVGALTNSSSAPAIYNGAVTLQSASSIGGNAGEMALIGPLNGAFPLTKVGSNLLFIVNDINNTTTTTISAGTLQVGNAFSTGSLGSGEVINNANLVFDRFNDNVVNNLISGSGTVTANSYYGTGRTILNNFNTYTGQTNVGGGVLVLGSATALGTTAGGTVVAAGASLDLNGNGFAVGAEALTIQGFGAVGATAALQSNNVGNSSWAGVVTLAGATTIGGNQAGTNLTLSNTVTGAFPLTKVGPNTLILSGANTYTGGTTIRRAADRKLPELLFVKTLKAVRLL